MSSSSSPPFLHPLFFLPLSLRYRHKKLFFLLMLVTLMDIPSTTLFTIHTHTQKETQNFLLASAEIYECQLYLWYFVLSLITVRPFLHLVLPSLQHPLFHIPQILYPKFCFFNFPQWEWRNKKIKVREKYNWMCCKRKKGAWNLISFYCSLVFQNCIKWCGRRQIV